MCNEQYDRFASERIVVQLILLSDRRCQDARNEPQLNRLRTRIDANVEVVHWTRPLVDRIGQGPTLVEVHLDN